MMLELLTNLCKVLRLETNRRARAWLVDQNWDANGSRRRKGGRPEGNIHPSRLISGPTSLMSNYISANGLKKSLFLKRLCKYRRKVLTRGSFREKFFLRGGFARIRSNVA